MSTRVSIAGHPVHPMLVPVPIGLWIFSLICDFAAVQAANFWLRMGDGGDAAVLPRAISIVAIVALVISGWLGGHLVHVLGVTQPHHGAEVARHRDEPHPRT